MKLDAELQATGEARYTQDLHLPKTPLESQFVLSKRSFAKFTHAKPIAQLVASITNEFPGVREYITYEDIPKPPAASTYNDQDPALYDPIFANAYVTAVGQPIGLILADTQHIAKMAALRMQDFIVYDTSGTPDSGAYCR